MGRKLCVARRMVGVGPIQTAVIGHDLDGSFRRLVSQTVPGSDVVVTQRCWFTYRTTARTLEYCGIYSLALGAGGLLVALTCPFVLFGWRMVDFVKMDTNSIKVQE